MQEGLIHNFHLQPSAFSLHSISNTLKRCFHCCRSSTTSHGILLHFHIISTPFLALPTWSLLFIKTPYGYPFEIIHEHWAYVFYISFSYHFPVLRWFVSNPSRLIDDGNMGYEMFTEFPFLMCTAPQNKIIQCQNFRRSDFIIAITHWTNYRQLNLR